MADDSIPRNKKGQFTSSGHPAGRTPGSKSYVTKIAKQLSVPIPVRGKDGKYKYIDQFEAAYLALCQNALKGDNTALFTAIDTMFEIAPPEMEYEEVDYKKIEQELGDLLRSFAEENGLTELPKSLKKQ